MHGQTKILLLEDNSDDAEIIQRQLKDKKCHYLFHRAVDKETYIDALNQFQPDIILSDHSLPSFDSMEALSLARERFPGIPFILITGTVSEELAATLLQYGAEDFILKDRLARLPAALNGALEKRKLEKEKLKAVEQLVRSEAKYRTLFIKSPLPKWIYDSVTLRFLEVNEAALRLYGYTAEEFLRMSVTDILPRENLDQLSHDLSQLSAEHDTRKNYEQHFTRKGDILLVETTAHYIDYNDRQARIVTVHDITERKKAEASLREMEKEVMQQQLFSQKKIIRAILEAQEKERNHIGSELHDNVNQILASTKMHLDNVGSKNEKIKGLLSYPMQLIETAIQEIRRLTHGYVSPTKNIPFIDLVERLLEMLPAEPAMRTELIYSVNEDLLSEELKLHLYRIMQEQINNVVKHANAQVVRITMSTNSDAIHLEISDNGKGMDLAQKRKGIGLSNMIHRIESFNGEITIDSTPGQGCTIRIRIPHGA